MVDFSKPTKIPEWADAGVVVEPSEAKKDSGWVAPELPPDTFFNWWQNLAGQWIKWLDERLKEGVASEDFTVAAPSGPTNGGDMFVAAGDAGAVAGSGGDARLDAGDGGSTSGAAGNVVAAAGSATVGDGGDASLNAGNGSASGGAVNLSGGNGSSGPGGAISLSAGDGSGGNGGAMIARAGDGSIGGALILDAGNANTTNDGASASLGGGDADGLNRDGGDVTVAGGRPTGLGSVDVILRAKGNGPSGSALQAIEDYLKCDGANERVNAMKRIEASYSGSDRGPFRIVPKAALPTTGIVAGEFAAESGAGNKATFYDGSLWEELARKRLITLADATQLVAGGTFDQSYDVPSNTLRVGSIIKMKAWGSVNPSVASNVRLTLMIDGVGAAALGVNTSLTSSHGWMAEWDCIVRSIGGTGSLTIGYKVGVEDSTTASSRYLPSSVAAFAVDTTQPLTLAVRLDNMTFGTADMHGLMIEAA